MAQRLKTDWILLFTIAALVVFGLIIVTSASGDHGGDQIQIAVLFRNSPVLCGRSRRSSF